jgi:hypothetical protein
MALDAVPAGLTGLLKGMHERDVKQVGEHVADDITLKSPIFEEPFVGREQALSVLAHLLSVVDEFESGGVLGGDGKFAVLLKLKAGKTEVEGVDIVTVNTAGKVDTMTIQWRPLSAIVAVQNRLAPAIGVPALTLAPRA